MSIADIFALILVTALIAVCYWLIRDANKKGVPLCGKSCGGCPHPCHSDGTLKEEFKTGLETEASKESSKN